MIGAACNFWGCPWPAKMRTVSGRRKPPYLCEVHFELAKARAEEAKRRNDALVIEELQKIRRRKRRAKRAKARDTNCREETKK